MERKRNGLVSIEETLAARPGAKGASGRPVGDDVGQSMRNRERVLVLVRSEPGGLTDSEIRQRTGIEPHQQVNQICRRLAEAGLIQRRSGREGRLINLPAGSLEENPQPKHRRDSRKDGRPVGRHL